MKHFVVRQCCAHLLILKDGEKKKIDRKRAIVDDENEENDEK